mgnify:CR=1 FL=1
MSVTINGTTGVDTPAVTADSTNVLNLKSEGVTRAYVSASGLTVNRINSASEGGQLDLCRSSDNTSAWAVDVYGSTSTPSLRFVDNVASATRAEIDGSANFKFNSGYGSVATAYGCRAWVNFNGTGTVAIRASGNVTSITDQGTGNYRANFTNAMPDANYSRVFSSEQISLIDSIAPSTTTYADMRCINLAGTATDAAYISLSVFR